MGPTKKREIRRGVERETVRAAETSARGGEVGASGPSGRRTPRSAEGARPPCPRAARSGRSLGPRALRRAPPGCPGRGVQRSVTDHCSVCSHLPAWESAGCRMTGTAPGRSLQLQVRGAHRLADAGRRDLHPARLQPRGRESQAERQRTGGGPARVFVFKLFSSPRSPESHATSTITGLVM